MVPHRESTPLWRRNPETSRCARGRNCTIPRPCAANPRYDCFQTDCQNIGRNLCHHRGGQPNTVLHRHHHLDAYVLTRQNVDQGLEHPTETATAPPYTVQQGYPVGHDRYGFHEPQPKCPRRPRVWPHRVQTTYQPRSDEPTSAIQSLMRISYS